MALFNRKTTSTGDAAGTIAVLDSRPTAGADLLGDYVVDAAHTRIGFAVKHAMVTTVRGAFKEFEGTAKLDPANPGASSVEIRIKVASVDTGSEQRDGHLRTADFFEAEKYPEMTFVSTAVQQVDDDTFAVTGDLTIKDVTRPVTIDFTVDGSARDPFGNLRVGFEGSTTVNRTDWGLTWNSTLETGGVLVSEKVKLDFDVSAIQVVPATA